MDSIDRDQPEDDHHDLSPAGTVAWPRRLVGAAIRTTLDDSIEGRRSAL